MGTDITQTNRAIYRLSTDSNTLNRLRHSQPTPTLPPRMVYQLAKMAIGETDQWAPEGVVVLEKIFELENRLKSKPPGWKPGMVYEETVKTFQKADCPWTGGDVCREDFEEALEAWYFYENEGLEQLGEIEEAITDLNPEEGDLVDKEMAAHNNWVASITPKGDFDKAAGNRRWLPGQTLQLTDPGENTEGEWCDQISDNMKPSDVSGKDWVPDSRLLDLVEMAQDMAKWDYEIQKVMKKSAAGSLVEKEFSFKNCSFNTNSGYTVAETDEGEKIYLKAKYVMGGYGVDNPILRRCGGYLENIKSAKMKGYLTVADVKSKMPWRIENLDWVKVC